jgi:electron transport complex protein RnfB
MSPVVIAVIVITLLGLAFGLILSVAGKKLAVEVDTRIEQITALLPGANCGSCGHAGCASMADAIVSGQEADASKCAACSEANRKAIAAVMGKAAEDGPKVRLHSQTSLQRLHC